MKILVAGATGNLGTRIAGHLLAAGHELRLLVHRRPLPDELAQHARAVAVRGDLADPATLGPACEGVDCAISVAGVLFEPRPERFLETTNVTYVGNLLEAARRRGARRFLLVSFPHVEGDTTPEHPATGRLDAAPTVAHFRTRRAAERLVIERCEGTATAPVIFRAATVYARGLKLVEGARGLLQKRLLAVWRRPTWLHLVALPDFLGALQAAVEKEGVRGIYQVGDEAPLTLQDCLDRFAERLGVPHPRRLPEWTFHAAAAACEGWALAFGTSAPLTRDFMRAGMVSSVADIGRMKRELWPVLRYPSFAQGIELL
ncbi:MAG TPA: NAD(P)-dependent oxidoreductase [Myxococcales bacterium]|nr:NAD(P)-dependent oxidoreductase [Myxococcales bacterium]